MKRFLSFVFEILVKLGACLAALTGCSSKNPPEPEKPHTIHWKGQDSGYEDATTIQPADAACSIGNK